MTSGIDGQWDVCIPTFPFGIGFKAVWTITEADDELIVVVQPGSRILWCLPYCCSHPTGLSTNRLKKDEDGNWGGKWHCRTLSLTIKDLNTLQMHIPYDATLLLTRRVEDEE